MAKHCGVSRFVFNWALSRVREEYQRSGRRPSVFDLQRELNQRKQGEWSWMYEVAKGVPQAAMWDLDRAIRSYLRGMTGQRKRRVGYPRFKGKRAGRGSFRVSEGIRIGKREIRLPRLGRIRLKERGYLPMSGAHIFSATVSERAGRWFVSVQAEMEIEVPRNVGPRVGVDLGLDAWMTLSDSSVIQRPSIFRKLERKLRRLHRSAARKKPDGKNRAKAYLRLAGLHRRVAAARNDWIHKVTTELAKTKSVIVLEDIYVTGLLRNRWLAKHLTDAAFAEVRRQLTYKTEWYGSRLVLAPRFFASTKTCSRCGALNLDITLDHRTFSCQTCGYAANRDLNAAQNLYNVAARSAETKTPVEQEYAGRLTPTERPCDEAGTATRRRPAFNPWSAPL